MFWVNLYLIIKLTVIGGFVLILVIGGLTVWMSARNNRYTSFELKNSPVTCDLWYSDDWVQGGKTGYLYTGRGWFKKRLTGSMHMSTLWGSEQEFDQLQKKGEIPWLVTAKKYMRGNDNA